MVLELKTIYLQRQQNSDMKPNKDNKKIQKIYYLNMQEINNVFEKICTVKE